MTYFQRNTLMQSRLIRALRAPLLTLALGATGLVAATATPLAAKNRVVTSRAVTK
mgnify:CR=1 FL=1